MAETADSGGLLVQIGVTQARMERELAQVVKQAAKAAQQTEDSFRGANDNIGKSFGAFGKAVPQINNAGAAIKNTSGYTANLASQLNDIGVQLAGGQSPFLIMIQQGTQISQLFAQTGGSFKSFGSLLTGAITSALNPFSLLTFAVIGLGGAAVQYFASIVSGGEDSNKTLEEQTKLVQTVAKTWGEAVPALQAYVDQLQRAADIADLQAVAQKRQSDVLAQVSAQFDEFAQKNADIGVLLYQAALNPQAPLHDLGEAYTQLAEKVANGTAKAEDFKRVSDALDASPMAAQLGAFGDAFKSIAYQISIATAELNKFLTQAGQAARTKFPSPGTYANVDRTAEGPIQGESNPLPEVGPTIEPRPSTESMYPGGTWSKPRSGGGSKRGANSYKDEVTGIKERTAALRESTAAQAAVNPLVNDYGFALEKAKAEQKLLADAQRSGLAITPQLRDQISELATGYAQASVEAKQLSESQNKIRKNAEEWASLEKDVFKGFISDLKDGKSGAEALSNALNKVADKLLDMAVNSIFDTKSGTAGGGGGIFSSLLGGIGKLLGFSSGTSNTGGKRGQPVGVVHGQEAVIPLPAGGKVPVQIATPSVPSGKSSRDVVAINLTDDSGRMADVADQRIQTASGTIVQVSVNQSYKQVKSNMASLITDTQARSL